MKLLGLFEQLSTLSFCSITVGISFTLEGGYHRNKKGAGMPEASVASRGKLRAP